MQIHQVRYFLAVCETLNFTRASEACNVTQPALTRAIQKLEEELGGLLIPTSRTVLRNTQAATTTANHMRELRLRAVW